MCPVLAYKTNCMNVVQKSSSQKFSSPLMFKVTNVMFSVSEIVSLKVLINSVTNIRNPFMVYMVGMVAYLVFWW